ncbi:MAG: hypothetical protein KAW12_28010 [Candidatus Aminicenantes bacterium]|nr:hypothetical protein [Candidatus Aminicenantes bacterium]
MKIILIILIGLVGTDVMENKLNLESIRRDSEIKIVHSCHGGTSVFIKSIDGKVKALNHIEFIASCSRGNINIKKSYFTVKDGIIVKEEHVNTSEYISLWKDVINIGLEDLDLLPLDDAVDPFEFIDSWRIDQDTIYFHFKVGKRKISFNLYDIESYRDKRFKIILNSVLVFIGEEPLDN